MTSLLSQSYSLYAQRLLDSRRVTVDNIISLKNKLPLLAVDLKQIIHDNTPIHHDAEYAAGVGLRTTRSQLMLALMEHDLSETPTQESLNTITQTISQFADIAVKHGLEIIRKELCLIHGDAYTEDGKPMPLWVMGMGKLSGMELNVSSDIDLIYVFEKEGRTTAISAEQRIRSISHSEFFDKLGKRLIRLLDDVTEYGFVFRVDMRLRPNGSSGALCVSMPTLEKYFVGQARTWERFVWLKSRLINPSTHSNELIQLITPFVFRRYLDYDAIDAIRDIHHKIRQKANQKHNEVDIKIGAGGIREIEFIIQLFQLIKGARDTDLTQKATLKILPKLLKLELLSEIQTNQLAEYYIFLRHLEHRIQYINDAQTQILPSDPDVLSKLASAMHYPDTTHLLNQLTNVQKMVSSHFNQLFEPIADEKITHQSVPQNDEQSGFNSFFDEPNTLQESLQRIESDKRLNQLPERSLNRYQQLVRNTLSILTKNHPSPIPVDYAVRVFNFLDAIAKRSSYLALLIEYPKALEHLIKLFTRSRWTADYLTAHPILLDELLTPVHLHAPPDWQAIEQKLHDELSTAQSNVELQMDILRDTRHAQIFRLLAQELDNLWTVEQLADHLSELTDLLLRQTLHFCWLAYPKRHQETPLFTIIAYGKLGGKEMGYASDLDLVFLFEDPFENAMEIYTRFAQRLNTWLVSPTASGVLFETDYRLRPNGASGLLVSSLNMFKQYQNESAWFWEHQAITRARYCVGNQKIGDWFERERINILQSPRDKNKVIQDILDMRQKIKAGHPNPTDLFDVKYDEGGMVDIEFCVQALVLLNSHTHPELLKNKGNIALLHIAAQSKFISLEIAESAAGTYRHYRALQHASRLQNIRYTRVAYVTESNSIVTVKTLLNFVLRHR